MYQTESVFDDDDECKTTINPNAVTPLVSSEAESFLESVRILSQFETIYIWTKNNQLVLINDHHHPNNVTISFPIDKPINERTNVTIDQSELISLASLIPDKKCDTEGDQLQWLLTDPGSELPRKQHIKSIDIENRSIVMNLGIINTNSHARLPKPLIDQILTVFQQMCIDNQYITRSMPVDCIGDEQPLHTAVNEFIEAHGQLTHFNKNATNEHLLHRLVCRSLVEVYLNSDNCNNSKYFKNGNNDLKFIQPRRLSDKETIEYINSCSVRQTVAYDNDKFCNIAWSRDWRRSGVSSSVNYPSVAGEPLTKAEQEMLISELSQTGMTFHEPCEPFILTSKAGCNTDLFNNEIFGLLGQDYGAYVWQGLKTYLTDAGCIKRINHINTCIDELIKTTRVWMCAYDRLALVIPCILFRDSANNPHFMYLCEQNFEFIQKQLPTYRWDTTQCTDDKYMKMKKLLKDNANNKLGDLRDFWDSNNICSKYLKFNLILQFSLSFMYWFNKLII